MFPIFFAFIEGMHAHHVTVGGS